MSALVLDRSLFPASLGSLSSSPRTILERIDEISKCREAFFFVDDLGFRTLHLLDCHSKISVCRNCISDISALNCRGDFCSGRKH
ncbi:unnamed protein product, partial [Musa banksii]